MKYATVCSGIEAHSFAVRDMPEWEPVFFSEIDPFCSELLRIKHPGVPNLGDLTKIKGKSYEGKIDCLSGGTPCQGFSMAGLRAGAKDPRSGLCRAFIRLVRDIRPRWVVWENVTGALSANGGADFAGFVSSLAKLGYGVSWRVLDARYTRCKDFMGGLPTARRRVWLVAYLGSALPAQRVLFDCPATPVPPEEDRASLDCDRLPLLGYDSRIINDQGGYFVTTTRGYAATLMAGSGHVIFRRLSDGSLFRLEADDWDELMGFSRGYTRIPWRGKPPAMCPSSLRMTAIGNSWAVNQARFVLRRLHFEHYGNIP